MLQNLLFKELTKKTAEATENLIRNNIADKITSISKIKIKQKEKNMKQMK